MQKTSRVAIINSVKIKSWKAFETSYLAFSIRG